MNAQTVEAVQGAPVGAGIRVTGGRWSFAGLASGVFEHHIRQSVPDYDAGHDLVCDLSEFFCLPDSVCYEIGSSTGTLLRKLAGRHCSSKPGIRWVGIESIDTMVEEARRSSACVSGVEFQCADARQPEFVDLDPRRDRTKMGYRVTPEYLEIRYRALLPPDVIAGKRVLDLGSCLSAAGAWCLTHGASFYQGVEIQPAFVCNARSSLARYYAADRWDVTENSIERYLDALSEPFDIVIAAGVLQGSADPVSLLKAIARNATLVVIDALQPRGVLHSRRLSYETRQAIAKDPGIVDYLENESFSAVGSQGMVLSDHKTASYVGVNPSMGAVKQVMSSLGFQCSDQPNQFLRKALPDNYSPLRRYALFFLRSPALPTVDFGFERAIRDPANMLRKNAWD